jgi:hypothetical protein
MRTRAYAERRTAEGKTKNEIIRGLKRSIAREIYRSLHAHTQPGAGVNSTRCPVICQRSVRAEGIGQRRALRRARRRITLATGVGDADVDAPAVLEAQSALGESVALEARDDA